MPAVTPGSKEDYARRRSAVAARATVEAFLQRLDHPVPAQLRASLRNIHDWRWLVPAFAAAVPAAPDLEDIYCFGAAHGHTVRDLVLAYRAAGLALPRLHAFDSFMGLPDEEPGVPAAPNFVAGAYACTMEEFLRRVDALALPSGALTVHPGWFADTLQPSLISSHRFAPAVYVDVDCDLYVSTRDALRFMLRHRLLRRGSLIGYDDWGDSESIGGGESRAHHELVDEFGLAVTELFSWGEPPLVRKLFRLESVSSHRDASGR